MDADGRIVGASERASKETPRGTFVTAAAADGRTGRILIVPLPPTSLRPPVRPSVRPSPKLPPLGAALALTGAAANGRSASQSALQSAPGGEQHCYYYCSNSNSFSFLSASNKFLRSTSEGSAGGGGKGACCTMPHQRGRTFVPRDVAISSADAHGKHFTAKLCSIHSGDPPPIQTQDSIVFLYSRSYRQ